MSAQQSSSHNPILTLTRHFFASAAFGVQKTLDLPVPLTGEAIK
jgi:hypothetical protein